MYLILFPICCLVPSSSLHPRWILLAFPQLWLSHTLKGVELDQQNQNSSSSLKPLNLPLGPNGYPIPAPNPTFSNTQLASVLKIIWEWVTQINGYYLIFRVYPTSGQTQKYPRMKKVPGKSQTNISTRARPLPDFFSIPEPNLPDIEKKRPVGSSLPWERIFMNIGIIIETCLFLNVLFPYIYI